MSDLTDADAKAWPEKQLGDIFRINGEQVVPLALSKAEFVHYSIPAWDATGGPTIELGSQIESGKTAVTRPSVLVSKLNPRKPRALAVVAPTERTCCSTEFICYQPKVSNQDLGFWAAYFASAEFAGRLARVAVGSTNSHTRAAPRETLGWLVPAIPYSQQRKLAEILDTLDTAILETEAIIAKLKAVKQGLLHDLLTRGIDANGELRPPQAEAPYLYKQSTLGWIPNEWEDVELGAVTDWASGGTPSRSVPGNWVGPVPLLTPKDMKSFEMGDTSEHISLMAAQLESRVMSAETVFIVVRGMILAHTFPVVLGTRPMAFNQDVKAVTAGARLRGRFLAHWFVGSENNFLRKVTEATHGTKKLDMDDLLRMAIGLPPPAEQHAVIERLATADRRCADEAQHLAQLGALKSGLMDDLLTGRVRVTPLLAPAGAGAFDADS